MHKISLRPLRIDDASDEYLSWLNDPEVNRYSRRTGETMDGLRAWLAEDVPGRFAIMLDGRHIGGISLSADNEISIMIGARDCWGHGYATEAIRQLTDLAFAQGVEMVWAESPNPAFNATMRKLGWTHTGSRPDPLGQMECWAIEASPRSGASPS